MLNKKNRDVLNFTVKIEKKKKYKDKLRHRVRTHGVPFTHNPTSGDWNWLSYKRALSFTVGILLENYGIRVTKDNGYTPRCKEREFIRCLTLDVETSP